MICSRIYFITVESSLSECTALDDGCWMMMISILVFADSPKTEGFVVFPEINENYF